MKHKSIFLEQLNVFSRYYLSMFLVFMALISCTGGDKKTTPPPVQTGGPQFVINSPAENTKIASPVFFSVQPFNASEVASVTFQAGDKELKNDVPYEDDFKVFVDPSDFPTGTLKLTATVTGKDGKQSSKSIDIDVINPADLKETATVRADGAILGTKEANGATSILTIPAGTAQGANVSFEARTKQEVKAATGVDYDALGVTFLGAQEVTGNKPLDSALMVASGGFGPMVQPGQAVVQYAIAPDGDGDGVGELVVVNTASVAPNGDVVSDPQTQSFLGDAVSLVTANSLKQLAITDTISAHLGSVLEAEVSGFNPSSQRGAVAIFESQVADEPIQVFASIYQVDQNRQIARVSLPYLGSLQPVDSVKLSFFDRVKQQETDSINMNLSLPPTLDKDSDEVINDFFDVYIGIVEGQLASVESNGSLSASIKNQYIDLGNKLKHQLGIMQNNLIEFHKLLEEIDSPQAKEQFDLGVSMLQVGIKTVTSRSLSKTSLCEDLYNDIGSAMEDILLAALPPVIVDIEAIKQGDPVEIAKLALAGAFFGAMAAAGAATLAGSATAITIAKIAGSLGAAVSISHGASHMLKYLEYASSPQDSCQPSPPPCQPTSSSSGGGTIGMGAASPPGGNSCGGSNSDDSSTQSLRTTALFDDLAGRIVVKVFVNSQALPFTGITDAGGYFYIPFIPAGQPFTAVATDQETGKQRTFDGVGPQTGESTYMYFNFFADATTDLTVTTTANSGQGSLRQIVADAQAGERIGFDVTGTITLSSEIMIDKLLFIDGPSAEQLSISGGNKTRLFNIAKGTVVNISGLTLEQGKADNGGAIFNSGELNLLNMVLTGNEATINGGAIYHAEGTEQDKTIFSLINSTISNNKAGEHGGGVYGFGIDGVSEKGYIEMTIKDSTISDNKAVAGAGGGIVAGRINLITITNTDFLRNSAEGDGGGLYTGIGDDSVTITDSTFSGNTSGDWGGAVYGSEDLFIVSSLFQNNQSTGRGGAINFRDDISIEKSAILNNSAGSSGGGLNSSNRFIGTVTLVESLVANNESGRNGGGINAEEVISTNSTIANNTAQNKGGGANVSLITLNNSTITDNTADNGGGVDVFVSGEFTAKNSIIIGNSATEFPDVIVRGSNGKFTSLGHNIVGSTEGNGFVDGVNNDVVGADPLLQPLADNGGPTQTMALGTGSPAIDAIPTGDCSDHEGTALSTDQRGITRPQGSGCDIGAYEVN